MAKKLSTGERFGAVVAAAFVAAVAVAATCRVVSFVATGSWEVGEGVWFAIALLSPVSAIVAAAAVGLEGC